MKMRYFLGLAVLLALAGSCKKDEIKNPSEFTASIENDEGDSKTYLDGYKVRWNAGDQMKVFGNGTGNYTIKDGEGTQWASFTGSGVQVTETYRGFYPVGSSPTCSGDVFTFTMPATQTYNANGFANHLNPMAGKSDGNYKTVIRFKNAFAILKLQTKGNRTVSKIEVTVPTGKYVYGQFTFDRNSLTTTYVSGGGQTITLDCSSNPVALNSTTEQDFYIVLPPGSIDNGFDVKYYRAGSETPFFTQNVPPTASNLALARNTIKKLSVTANAETLQVVNLVPVLEDTYWEHWWYAHHCNNTSLQVTVGNYSQTEPGFDFCPQSNRKLVFRTKETIHLISGHTYYARFHAKQSNYTSTSYYSFWWPDTYTPDHQDHSSPDTFIFNGQYGSSDNTWYCRSGQRTLNVTTGDYYAGIELNSPALNVNVSQRYVTGAMLIDLTATYEANGLPIPSTSYLDGLQYFHTNPMDLSVWDPGTAK